MDTGFHEVVDLLIEGIVLLALSLKFVDGSIFGAQLKVISYCPLLLFRLCVLLVELQHLRDISKIETLVSLLDI